MPLMDNCAQLTCLPSTTASHSTLHSAAVFSEFVQLLLHCLSPGVLAVHSHSGLSQSGIPPCWDPCIQGEGEEESADFLQESQA